MYVLIGVSKATISTNPFSIATTFDISKEAVKVSVSGRNDLEVTYLAVGEPSQKVCQPCDAFISITGCLEECPNNSYPLQLQSGAHTCRKCIPELGQTLSNDGSTCTCPNA